VLKDVEVVYQQAVQDYWRVRRMQSERQQLEGRVQDAGDRSAVTGGQHLNSLINVAQAIVLDAGLTEAHIRLRQQLELPGYFRSEKRWDLLVIVDGKLLAAIEFKAIAGSFGNNMNNRSEEAIGNASDFWTAYRESRFGIGSPRPLLGFLFLLKDCEKVHSPVRNWQPHFKVDPVFKNASYSTRARLLLQRLCLERLYDTACLTLATDEDPTRITYPASDLNFTQFAAALEGHILGFLKGRT
jgi:hypothetical protein